MSATGKNVLKHCFPLFAQEYSCPLQKGRDAAAMQAAADQMRQDVANRIRTGALDIVGDGETKSRSGGLGNVVG